MPVNWLFILYFSFYINFGCMGHWKGEQNNSDLCFTKQAHFSLLFLIPCPLFLFFFSLPLSPVCLSCIIYCCWCSLSARLVFIYLLPILVSFSPSPSVLYNLLNTLSLSNLHIPASFSLLSLPFVACRHLCKSPSCGRRFLWARPFGSLSLCLLEAVLAHLEKQGALVQCWQLPAGGAARGPPGPTSGVSFCFSSSWGQGTCNCGKTAIASPARRWGRQEEEGTRSEGQWPQLG